MIVPGTLPLDGLYQYSSLSTGSGVDVYVLGTGVRATHNEFSDIQIVGGPNFVDDACVLRDLASGVMYPDCSCLVVRCLLRRASTIDCNGHGTHVASVIAGKTYGVAKGVRLISVRVLVSRCMLEILPTCLLLLGCVPCGWGYVELPWRGPQFVAR
jgi:subtilisin family serine protease